MINPIRGATVLGAVPVARVRRKTVRQTGAVDAATLDIVDHDTLETASPDGVANDIARSFRRVGPEVLAALLKLRHGG